MGEFEEVGNTVKAFSSDNATVVVGTIIDQQMEDEVRVTVVATGIGSQHVRSADKPSLMENTNTEAEKDVDYAVLERPTIIRNQPEPAETITNEQADPDYLDIPAFLRRQAD